MIFKRLSLHRKKPRELCNICQHEDMLKRNSSIKTNFRNALLHIVCLAIRDQQFLEFWLVFTWFFPHPHDQRAVTRLENVRQLNIRRGKKPAFQLSQRQPLWNIYIPVLVISFLLHNLIHKVWVDLINKRQPKAQGFLGKISESHEINLSRGQWVLPENYIYLHPTELLDLCCYVVQFIPLDCGSVAIF